MADLVGEALERRRGDTAPDTIAITTAAGAPLDITGFHYRMTVNTLKAPDTDNPGEILAAITGEITDAAAGAVEFPWTAEQADQAPGKYWYDIEQTDAAGKIKTIAKNSYRFRQDISK